jgi:ABC-type lipoprotein release transport system permease subunit
VAAGVAIAAALTQFVASLLFGVSAVDPIAFVGVPGLLIVVAFLACARPSHRAVSMDPAMVLRSE